MSVLGRIGSRCSRAKVAATDKAAPFFAMDVPGILKNIPSTAVPDLGTQSRYDKSIICTSLESRQDHNAANKEDNAANKEDNAANKEDAANTEDNAANKEDDAANKEDNAANKEDNAANKEDKAANKEDKAANKEDKINVSVDRCTDSVLCSTGSLGDREIEKVYWVYATVERAVTAIVANECGDLLTDLGCQPTVEVVRGSRVRLHYPMRSHQGTRYMKLAQVHPETGQFVLLHFPVYSECMNGDSPVRYVGRFES